MWISKWDYTNLLGRATSAESALERENKRHSEREGKLTAKIQELLWDEPFLVGEAVCSLDGKTVGSVRGIKGKIATVAVRGYNGYIEEVPVDIALLRHCVEL